MANDLVAKSSEHKRAEQTQEPSRASARQPASNAPHHDVLSLQRSMGNLAVSHMLGSIISTLPSTGAVLQRKCAACAKSGGECAECQKKHEASSQQPPSQGEGKGVKAVPPIAHEVLRSPGQPLDLSTRAFMESRFGHDFDHVRLHTDGKAAESASAVNAQAYTIGQHIVFGAGEFSPATGAGLRLLAHELIHTIQQKRPGPHITGLRPDNPSERAAESAAQSVLQGGAVSHLDSTTVGMARQFRSVNYRQLNNEDLKREYELVRDRVLQSTDYPERDADTHYLAELEGEVRFRGIAISLPAQAQEGGVGQPAGPRAVRAVRFVAPDFFGDTIELGETSVTQTQPDPSAGYNFDTYLLNETTGRRIPAQHMGGTRYRVLMGTPECPGCHFGRGLEVDLHGENFLLVMAPQLLAGAAAFRGVPRVPPSRQLPPGPPTRIPPSRQLPPGPPTTIPPSRQLPPGPERITPPSRQLPAGPETVTPPSRQLPAGQQPVTRMSRPPIPQGVSSTNEFGTKIMRWGTGNEAARTRIASLTREELQRAGVTREMAEAWRDFYRNEMLRNPNNPSAPGRADLMQRAIELLSGGQ
jgi:acyl dehydratase